MRRGIPIAVLVLAVAGCTATKKKEGATVAPPDPATASLSTDPVVLGPAAGASNADSKVRRKVSEDDAFYAEKYDTASRAGESGDDESALALITAALKLGPKAPWDERFKTLRANVKTRHLEVDVLRAEARGVKDYVTFGSPVDFVVRLRNVGASDLVFKPPPSATKLGDPEISSSSLFLEIRRRDHDIYGAAMSRSWTQVVPLIGPGDPEIRIPPESVREVRVRIPADDAGGAVSGLHALEVSGNVRLSRLEAGIAEPVSRIPIRAGRVIVVPGNYEPLAADPLGSLDRALRSSALVHVLLAAEFVSPVDRVQAVRRMADAIATGPSEVRPPIDSALVLYREESGREGSGVAGSLTPLVAPLMLAMESYPTRVAEIGEAITALTQVSLAPDLRLWQEWWRRGAPLPAAKTTGHAPPK